MNENEMNEEVYDIKTLTGGEFLSKLSELHDIQLGSNEHEKATKDVVMLGNLMKDLEQQQINYETEMLKQDREERKLEFEKEKFEEEKRQANAKAKLDKIDTGIKAGASIGIPIFVQAMLRSNWIKGLKFEELGTITSRSVGSLIGKVLKG